MKNQLELFQEPKIEYRPAPRYFELSINEKINVKANSCGFQINWLRTALPWCKNHLGKILRYDYPDRLTEKYFMHYKINNKRKNIKTGQLTLI